MSKTAANMKPKAISGAEKKAMQKQLDELPTLEETWENAHQAFINTAEVSVTLANRIDNLMNLRDMALKFWGDAETIEQCVGVKALAYYKELLELSKITYELILEIVKTFEMEEFLKEDMKDYFEEAVPKLDDIMTEDEMLRSAIVFLTVKPWGEKMTALHHTMLDEKKQREYLEQ